MLDNASKKGASEEKKMRSRTEKRAWDFNNSLKKGKKANQRDDAGEK